jgi:hypothetical protein
MNVYQHSLARTGQQSQFCKNSKGCPQCVGAGMGIAGPLHRTGQDVDVGEHILFSLPAQQLVQPCQVFPARRKVFESFKVLLEIIFPVQQMQFSARRDAASRKSNSLRSKGQVVKQHLPFGPETVAFAARR